MAAKYAGRTGFWRTAPVEKSSAESSFMNSVDVAKSISNRSRNILLSLFSLPQSVILSLLFGAYQVI